MNPDSWDRVRRFFSEEEDVPEGRGRYEIVREIGRGGMSVVYEARDRRLGRRVALKVLREVGPERVRREAEAAARLRHPNVVAVHEVGPDYIVMDLVAGRTLAEAMPELDRGERLRILEAVAAAVAHAHAHGVVHRDLKPANVLLEPDGRVVLTDFGLARLVGGEDLTRTGAVVGTPHYMAPELVRGEGHRAGPAADVWSLGVMLYEALSGRRPFDGATPLAIYERIVHADPEPLPGDFGAIAARALEKDPARRYPDAGAMAEDLRRARAGEPIRARRVGPLGRLWRRARRKPRIAALAVLALGALAAAGGLAA
ncbi:MAG TPA: serine/threonine-protein kinase, partial [Planctomycetota bacterium]|nr:serine/threonine-protein kinase [Planctomycetota bacterium]